MVKNNTTGLVWFGNDLRIHDHEVLSKASKDHQKLITVFFIDPRWFDKNQFGFRKMEVFRIQFLLETLECLRKELLQKNISLLVYVEKPENRINRICKNYDIDRIYKQKEWTSEEIKITDAVQDQLPTNIALEEIYNQFLYHPDDINIDINHIPQVFSNFRKKLEKYIKIRPETSLRKFDKTNLISEQSSIPTLAELGFQKVEQHKNTAFPYKGGEIAALERLTNYFFNTKKLGFYKKTRNGLVGTDYSSKFSPWLANGSLSAKTIYWNVKKFEQEHYKNQSTYWLIFELIWRDYFKYISMKHGNNIFKIEGILKLNYEWKNSQSLVQKWIDGHTHDDFVNANMIELKKTGWMSNRGRQNVASYFSKELKLDWRIGAAYFESLLLDYDVHSNYGNWMYVSGVGNDPRNRTFNTQLQAQRYDENHRFRKLWLQPSLF